jgi:hypothetical protein
MQYRTSSPNLPKNVLLHLFRLVDNMVSNLLNEVCVGGFNWLLPEGRSYIAATLVRAIHDESFVDGVAAKTFVMKMEHLLAPFIDVLSVVCHFYSHVPLQFSLSLVENINSRNYLKKIMEEQYILWTVIDKLIRGERNVKVTCYEPYLNYPSECAILTQFLLDCMVHFDISIQGISCRLLKCNIQKLPMKLSDETSFSSFEAKKKMLHNMLSSSFRIPVTVKESSSQIFQPCVVFSNEHFELRIQTSHGIGYWWKALHAFKTPTKVNLMTDPMQDIELENKAMKNPAVRGVHFTITYTPNDNIKA